MPEVQDTSEQEEIFMEASTYITLILYMIWWHCNLPLQAQMCKYFRWLQTVVCQ
jgi:hypothetical protein